MDISTLYQTEGKVWKLIIDESHDLLLIEARDEEEREVTFSAIDLHQQKELWLDYLLEEPWWLTMQYAQNGILLITEFEDDQNPISKYIIAIDAAKGEGLWQMEGLFESANKEFALIKTNDSQLLQVGLRNGLATPLDTTGEASFSRDLATSLIFPQHYPQNSEYFNTVAAFLSDRLQTTPTLAIDYIEVNGLIIIAYYELNDIHYHHQLVIFSQEGKLIHLLALGQGLTGVGNEPFLLYKDLLLFVKDKKQVQSINLHHLL